jgi:hypothetical protein
MIIFGLILCKVLITRKLSGLLTLFAIGRGMNLKHASFYMLCFTQGS